MASRVSFEENISCCPICRKLLSLAKNSESSRLMSTRAALKLSFVATALLAKWQKVLKIPGCRMGDMSCGLALGKAARNAVAMILMIILANGGLIAGTYRGHI